MSELHTPPESRFERNRQRTRQKLMDATNALIFEEGYAALTIKRITERADMGYGTFYLHFRDKDDIVWQVTRVFIDTYLSALIEDAQQYPPFVREYVSFVNNFQYIALNRGTFLEMFGSQGSAYLSQQYQLYLADIYERNMRANVFTPGDIGVPSTFLAHFMAGAIVRLTLWWLETPNDYTPEQMAAMLFEAVYRQPPPQI